jgi:soluble lytic murein transglycosylase-like protein
MVHRKRTITLTIFSLSATLVLALMFCLPARADIYRYVDKDGVVHFSNAPTTPGYRVYVREVPRLRRISTHYDTVIAAAAREHGLPVSLIKAVIKAESNFDPYAVSRKGARGLMQIMPETARELGIGDCFDPEENIFGGTRYLKELLTQFEGSLPLALAAYNAGPSVVRLGNSVPPIEETRIFVRRVLQYLKGY